MPNVLLRTLTRKSIIGFGYYKDITVGQLIDLCRHKELLGIYYGLSKIDFSEDVKKELCMEKEDEIEKPGRGYGRSDWRINRVLGKLLNSISPEQLAINKQAVRKSKAGDKKRNKIVSIQINARNESRWINKLKNQPNIQ